jgi:hypothetical protein
MKSLHSIAFVLLVIGGLNWLLVGIFQWNLVEAIFNSWAPIITTVVYVLVGLSALYLIFTHKKTCKNCDNSATAPTQM